MGIVEHAPRATYRVQLHADFNFAQAAEIAGYLAELGVSHLYCSPAVQAAPGSRHGYDVVDPTQINGELGGETGFRQLTAALQAAGLNQVWDIVPNHMSTARENHWWWDVLENGPASRWASFFDIDWESPEAKLHGMVLLPLLGDHYGRLLEGRQFSACRSGGAFTLHYEDHVWPLSPRSMEGVLHQAAVRCRSDELAFLADSLAQLPLASESDRASVQRRHRDKEILRELLERLCRDQPSVADAIDTVLGEVNDDCDALHELLSRQNYRLAYWRVAGEELDYRRFFDITSLVAVRSEYAHVFSETHRLVLDLVREGAIDGLRIDHPDGLWDPLGYFQRLRADAAGTWIVAEKILAGREELRTNWPIQGTTGYEFLNLVNGLLVDPAGCQAITDIAAEFTGESLEYEEVASASKEQILRESFAGDVHRLTTLLARICDAQRCCRDYTQRDLHRVVRELMAAMPVYRTYVRPLDREVAQEDREVIAAAVAEARACLPDLDGAVFEFLERAFTLRTTGPLIDEFVLRFQQQTGPVMAKGIEDTAFYRFVRLLSLNEVGGEPGEFGVSLQDFHDNCRLRAERWPQSLNTLTTHDTKRSEDVRARLHLLAECPDSWQKAVFGWREHNQPHWNGAEPDRHFEYVLYQTLVGAWPIDVERVVQFAYKAIREAKRHTSWLKTDDAYEAGIERFVRGVMQDRSWIDRVGQFVAPLTDPGYMNSLTQTLVKLTAPGIPDTYQGTEIWDFSLVDPDNRRPVNYQHRRQLLRELDGLPASAVWSRRADGLPKLWLTVACLRLRQERPELFDAQAGYQALVATGSRAEHVVAFQRGESLIAAAPRWPLRLADDWQQTCLELPAGDWVDWLSERRFRGEIRVADLFTPTPVALLVRAR
jgi:(1->4)-alpha-D-glucan 1-alpha-D-glucosylmutase